MSPARRLPSGMAKGGNRYARGPMASPRSLGLDAAWRRYMVTSPIMDSMVWSLVSKARLPAYWLRNAE